MIGPIVTAMMLTQVAEPQIWLDSLEQIETSNHTRTGRSGERGPYQFREVTWKRFTKLPFANASKRDVSGRVALIARTANARQFESKTHRRPSLAEESAMWNVGFAGFERFGFQVGKLPAKLRDRCIRHQNLYASLFETMTVKPKTKGSK